MTMKYILAAPVRALVLTMVLLASSGLYPASAQDEGKPPASASQPAPAQTNQNSPPQNDMGRMMDRMGRGMDWDHRKVGHDLRMRRDDDDRDRDRGYRGSDRADRDGYGRGYYDEDRPRRRVKVCFEYENGDEYCRYRD
jgi:hypothetical protein